MLLVPGLMAAVVAVLLAFPDSGIGRSLNRWLVEAPARVLNRVRPGRMVFYALLAALGLVLVLLFEAEGLRLFGLMLPEILVWFAMFDVGVFIDALLISSAILASNGLRVVRARAEALSQQVVMGVIRLSARARRARRPARPGRKTAEDDRPAWAAQPAYRVFSMA